MTVLNQHNLTLWTQQVEIDYFTQFIKAWIPFNAWYRISYGQSASERQIIESIKADGNVVRGRIIPLLEGEHEEASEFKSHLARLHSKLEGCSLESRGKRITLTCCDVGSNNHNVICDTHNGLTYRLERNTQNALGNKVLSEILARKGSPLFSKIQDNYNLQELQDDPNFVQISIPQRDQLIYRYKSINPRIIADLLDTSDGSLKIGAYQFCANREHIYAGMIEVLYCLRCVLLHGEIVPNHDHNNVYEPAYHILKNLLRSII